MRDSQSHSADDTETEPDGGPVGETWARPQVGARLGRYVLVDELGAGAMGVVYTAHDEVLGRDVALKLIRPRRMQTAAAQDRFEQEARMLAAVRHPAVVEIYDVGRHAGRPYLVMPRLPGQTLRDWLRTPRSRADILAMFGAIAAGLAAAHAAEVLHCDFKPDNVLLDVAGRPKVADFGLARLDVPETQADRETGRSATISGTPAYMAPELHRGAAPSIASDLYAFHVALYEALTGTRPFRGRDLEAKLRGMDSASLSKLPRALRRSFARSLDPNPTVRPRAFVVDATSRDRAARWWGLPLTVVAGVALAGAALTQMPSRRPTCAARADRVVDASALWTDPAENLAAQATIDRVGRHLDDWRERWRLDYVGACEAHDVGRFECLAKARVAGESWMEPPRLGGGELARAMRWSQRLSALPSLADCNEGKGAPHPAFAVELAEVRFSLDRGYAREAVAQGLATSARAQLANNATARFTAEVLAAEGLSEMRQFERAESLLRDVIAAAEATGRWTPATEAVIQLIWVVGVGNTDLDAARRLAKQADAYAHRAGTHGVRLRVQARAVLSRTLERQGELADAGAVVDEALAVLRLHPETKGIQPLRGELVSRRVSLAAKRNDTATVLDSAQAIEDLEQQQGKYSIAVMSARSALAHARGLAGQFGASVAAFEGVALRYAAMGEDFGFWVHQTSVNAAVMEVRAQRAPRAAARLEVACPAMTGLRSATHTNVLLCSLALLRAQALAGDPVSLDAALETLGVIEARFDPARLPVEQARAAAADIAVALGAHEQANALLADDATVPALQAEVVWLRAENEQDPLRAVTRYEAVCAVASPTLRPDLCKRALARLGTLAPQVDVAARERAFFRQ